MPELIKSANIGVELPEVKEPTQEKFAVKFKEPDIVPRPITSEPVTIQENPYTEYLSLAPEQRKVDEFTKTVNTRAFLEAKTMNEIDGGAQIVQSESQWAIDLYGGSQAKIQEIQDRGAIGFGEAYRMLNKWEMLPYLNGVALVEDVKILSTLKKMNDNIDSVSDEDLTQAYQYLDEMAQIQLRGFSFGGQMAYSGLRMPAYAVEFGVALGSVGGGAAATVSREATEAATKASIKAFVKAGAKRIAGMTLTGAKITANPRMLHRVAKSYASHRLNDSINITDKGQVVYRDAEESPAKTLMKSFGENWIENSSEVAGAYLFKPVVGAIGRKMPKGFGLLFRKSATEATGMNWTQSVAKFGYDGILEEMGEERVGDLLRTAFDLDPEEGYSMDQFGNAMFPDWDQLQVELGLIGIFGGVSYSGAALINKLSTNKDISKEQAIATVQNLSEVQKETVLERIKASETREDLAAYNKEMTKYKKTLSDVGMDKAEIDATTALWDAFATVATDKLQQKDVMITRSEWLKNNVPSVEAKEQLDGRRGGYDPVRNLITLLPTADRSTFIHESGHAFLETYLKELPEELETVFKWAGVKEMPHNGLTGQDYQKLQEKFATGFELYLREGKAPNSRLAEVFETFKDWLTQVYNSVLSVQVHAKRRVRLSNDIRDFYSEMLDVEKATVTEVKAAREAEPPTEQEPLAQAEPREVEEKARREEIYKTNIEINSEEDGFVSDVLQKSANVYQSGAEWLNRTLVPISSRLEKINPKLKQTLRRFEFNSLQVNQERNKQIVPFLEKYSKLSIEDARTLDYALKLSDLVKVQEIVDKNDMQKEYDTVVNMLENVYDDAKSVDLGVNYLENYFPRRINDPKKFMSYIKQTEQWTQIEEELKRRDPDNELTLEERAEFIGNMLRGFGGDKAMLSRPSFTKERQIIDLTPEMNSYYKDSSQAIIDYVRAMTEAIEARKLFGKSAKDIEGSISAVVDGMIKRGQISFKEEAEAKELLISRFNSKGLSGIWSLYRDFNYMTLLGSPISAVTQLEDLGVTMYKTGLFNTTKGLISSIAEQQEVSLDDLGLETITAEFIDERTGQKAIEKLFKITGFARMDRLGKESFINGTLNKYKQLAKKGDKKFLESLKDIFGDEAFQVGVDLKTGNISPNVKYLLFNELAEIQPLTLSEMPEYYVKGGNLRVLYSLKSFTLKRLDFMRRTIINEISTDPIKGMGNLARLITSLLVMGATTDYIKDFLLGRDPEPEDYVINNLFKSFGFGKWLIYQARREGLMSALSRQMLPPFKLFDDLYKDTINQRELPDWDTWASFPVVGKFYYWWFGRGAEKAAKRRKKKKKGKKI
ncbi:MAG: hypothetical protein GY861_15920 [bacterium]|nr:hypothetical protein [bacterium]